jgi:hypothetical protein
MKVHNFCIVMLAAFINTPVNAQSLPVKDSLKIIEKVYLHSDREIYYAGDNIWFKAYLVDATDRLLSNHSVNLHVELISPGLKIINSRIIRLDRGLGNGDFLLPGKMSSGRYRLRAYTNYMRNFNDELFFTKDITIINSLDADKLLSDSIIIEKDKIELNFYPEGGSLVDSVSSIVAFKAVNAVGTGSDVSGEVYSTSGEIITAFKSNHKGMGIFSLTPAPGARYYARIKRPSGEVIKCEIPASFSTGIALSISKKRENGLRVTIKTNKETLPLVWDHELSLIVSSRNMVYKTIRFKLKSLNNYYNIPVNDLPDGIIMLTISGTDNLPLCERLVYLQNNSDSKLKLETDKTVYKQRDSVTLKISFPKDYGKVQGAYLSLTAFDKKFTGDSTHFPATISSWFLLESDIRGPVEEPSYYFDSSNPGRLEDLDLLLLTQGWRDFKWKYNKSDYLPEYGFTISGRVRKLLADVPLEKAKVNIVISKKETTRIVTVPTDSSGRFSLTGIDFTGDVNLIISTIGKNEQLQGWLQLDSMQYSPAGLHDKIHQKRILSKDDQIKSTNQLAKNNLDNLIKDAKLKKAIRKKYKLSDTIDIPEIVITAQSKQEEHIKSSRAAYLNPDRELIITPDLPAFNTPLQLLGFYFSELKSRRYPSIIAMIDGIKVDQKVVQALPVDLIDRIDLLNTQTTVSSVVRYGSLSGKFGGNTSGNSSISVKGVVNSSGNGGNSGGGGGMGSVENDINGFAFSDPSAFYADAVINVITKANWNSPSERDYHSMHMKISGYDEARIFYSPRHLTDLKSDYKPDLRTTLFWEPNIKLLTNQELSLNYYNADNSSVIKVMVEGITSDGIPLTAKTEYEVK